MQSKMLARLMVHAGRAVDEAAAIEILRNQFARKFPGHAFSDFDTLMSPEALHKYVQSLRLPEPTTRPGLL